MEQEFLNSGYNYNWIGEEEFINKTKKFRSGKNNYLSRLKYRLHMKRYEKQFGIGMDVENKFNRLVVYKSPIAHKALNCFGRSRNDSKIDFLWFLLLTSCERISIMMKTIMI